MHDLLNKSKCKTVALITRYKSSSFAYPLEVGENNIPSETLISNRASMNHSSRFVKKWSHAFSLQLRSCCTWDDYAQRHMMQRYCFMLLPNRNRRRRSIPQVLSLQRVLVMDALRALQISGNEPARLQLLGAHRPRVQQQRRGDLA